MSSFLHTDTPSMWSGWNHHPRRPYPLQSRLRSRAVAHRIPMAITMMIGPSVAVILCMRPCSEYRFLSTTPTQRRCSHREALTTETRGHGKCFWGDYVPRGTAGGTSNVGPKRKKGRERPERGHNESAQCILNESSPIMKGAHPFSRHLLHLCAEAPWASRRASDRQIGIRRAAWSTPPRHAG